VPSVHYPVSLLLHEKRCLVVGGGTVASAKVRGLLEAGAAVTVVAPTVTAELAHLHADGRLVVERRAYVPGEVADFHLVITATGRPDVDRQVSQDASGCGVWVNSADDPANCTFFLPAVHRDGAVSVAVSTGGASPALAGWVRDHAARSAGPGLGVLAELLAHARSELKESGRPTGSVDWRALLGGPLPGLVRAGRLDEARRILGAALGRPD
jgi:precorrin-2 dehydrogenase/sirohydrochlorin ferrochelatase